MTELFQIFICGKSFWNRKIRQLGIAKLNFHMAAVRYLLRIGNRLLRIRKKRAHFLFGFDKKLSSLITHAVLIRKLFARLKTQQYIMGVRIRFVRIMNVVCRHQINARIF